jgi:hypothetical protein
MGLVVENRCFSDFVKFWAEELGRPGHDVAVWTAQAIIRGGLDYEVLNPQFPGPSARHEVVPFSEDPQWQEFDDAVTDHLWNIVHGIELPDFDDRLRYVMLRRNDVDLWCTANGVPFPHFWRPLDNGVPAQEEVGGTRSQKNLYKVIAVLAILFADTGDQFKHKSGERINVSELRDEIRALLESDERLSKLLGQGFSRARLDSVLAEALKVLEEENPENSP